MKILIDMNLSPDWVTSFADENIESVHWSTVGIPSAEDVELVRFALANDYIIFTHDLDFGTILALTHAHGPSVIQVRAQNILPSHLSRIVIAVVKGNQAALEKGTLITVEESRAKVRLLPLEKRNS